MLDFQTTVYIEGEDDDVDVGVEITHMSVTPPDPTTWASDIDYYGDKDAEYKVYRLDTGEEVNVEIDEKRFWNLLEEKLKHDEAY